MIILRLRTQKLVTLLSADQGSTPGPWRMGQRDQGPVVRLHLQMELMGMVLEQAGTDCLLLGKDYLQRSHFVGTGSIPAARILSLPSAGCMGRWDLGCIADIRTLFTCQV